MKNSHVTAIDAIRTICILAVIVIHTTTRSLELVHLNITILPQVFFLNQISRFAVPLFFLISGFVLQHSYFSQTSLLDFYKKRLSKLFIPYIFWSFIYYFFIYTHHSNGFFSALFSGESSYQLYFIPSLLIFYFIFPVLHKISGFLFSRYIFIALAIIQLFFLQKTYFLNPLTYYYPISIAFLNYFLFLFGMYTAKYQNHI